MSGYVVTFQVPHSSWPWWQVDRKKVLNEGKDAVGRLLVSLQVYKSTADGAGAREFYNKLTKPLPGWEGDIRNLVLRKKLVRFYPNELMSNKESKISPNSLARYLSSPILNWLMVKLYWKSTRSHLLAWSRVLSRGTCNKQGLEIKAWYKRSCSDNEVSAWIAMCVGNNKSCEMKSPQYVNNT